MRKTVLYRFFLLGRPRKCREFSPIANHRTAYSSIASKQEYDRQIAGWLAKGRCLSSRQSQLMAELIQKFWCWVQIHYRKDGVQTTEVGEYRASLRPLNHLYGSTASSEFGPVKFSLFANSRSMGTNIQRTAARKA
jgi:hypothetical protein